MWVRCWITQSHSQRRCVALLLRVRITPVCLSALLLVGCGRIGFDNSTATEAANDGGTTGQEVDAGPIEPVEFSVDRVAPDAIYGRFAGFDAASVSGIEVYGQDDELLRSLGGLSVSGDRFAILFGDETLAGLDVTVKIVGGNGAIVATAPILIPSSTGVSVVVPSGLHLSYFTDEFYIGLDAPGTHCLDLVSEGGEVHTDGGCVQFNNIDTMLIALGQLSGTIDINSRYSLCAQGDDNLSACTSLIKLSNHMPVERLVLDTVNSLFSIVLSGNISACIRIIDENQTQIVLNDPGSAHACVGTSISGYASQAIPLSELTSAIDPLLQYAICNIDGRGLAYSLCTPLAEPEMP